MSSRSASTFLSTTPTIRSMSGTKTSRWKRDSTVSRSSDIKSLFYRLAGPPPYLHITIGNADVEAAGGEGGGAVDDAAVLDGELGAVPGALDHVAFERPLRQRSAEVRARFGDGEDAVAAAHEEDRDAFRLGAGRLPFGEIGRASCRERV